jgi:hypothetical protein
MFFVSCGKAASSLSDIPLVACVAFDPMIALKKKTKSTKCSDHRTISLIAHTAKIIAKILKRRIERKIEDILGED